MIDITVADFGTVSVLRLQTYIGSPYARVLVSSRRARGFQYIVWSLERDETTGRYHAFGGYYFDSRLAAEVKFDSLVREAVTA